MGSYRTSSLASPGSPYGERQLLTGAVSLAYVKAISNAKRSSSDDRDRTFLYSYFSIFLGS